jgi:hypothetical protein
MGILKIILICLLAIIFYQDYKQRQVYWFLFPLSALCCAILFFTSTISELFISAILLNLSFVLLLLGVIFLYSKFKLKLPFNTVFGMGDVLLFTALIFTFSSVSFLIVFVFALIFSLILHLFLSPYSKEKTVPLAGYMSLFFALTYMSFWSGLTTSLYAL